MCVCSRILEASLRSLQPFTILLPTGQPVSQDGASTDPEEPALKRFIDDSSDETLGEASVSVE